MYVDDSGTSSLKDLTKYYVISGVIVDICDLFCIQKKVEQFRKNHFMKDYRHEEIHVHEIYHSKGNFEKITKREKYNLLNHIYQIIYGLPVTIISVGINKIQFELMHPDWDSFNVAWTFLLERFDRFISDNNSKDKGEIVVDISSNMNEREIKRIIKYLIKHGTPYQYISHVAEEPSFFYSETIHGIQVADAASYCTLRHLNGYTKFCNYWNIIMGKMRKGPGGKIDGYGFKVFP
jgi:hypothetical protein